MVSALLHHGHWPLPWSPPALPDSDSPGTLPALLLLLDHVEVECPRDFTPLDESSDDESDVGTLPPIESGMRVRWTSTRTSRTVAALGSTLVALLPPLSAGWQQVHTLMHAGISSSAAPAAAVALPAHAAPAMVDAAWTTMLEHWSLHYNAPRDMHPALWPTSSAVAPVAPAVSPAPLRVSSTAIASFWCTHLACVQRLLELLSRLTSDLPTPAAAILDLVTANGSAPASDAVAAHILALMSTITAFDAAGQGSPSIPADASSTPLDPAVWAAAREVLGQTGDPWLGRGAAQRDANLAGGLPAGQAAALNIPSGQTRARAPPHLKVLCLRLLCSLAADPVTRTGTGAAGSLARQPMQATAQWAMQELVHASQSLPLLLQHTLIEADNPYVREYVVLLLRLLAEDHAGIQADLRALEMRGIANEEALRADGLAVHVGDNGKVTVKTVAPPPNP